MENKLNNMSQIKVIKNEKDYEEALKLLEILIDKDPEPDSEEGDRLHILSALVKDYENREFPQSLPDPIEAIKFRMEQEDLKPTDLIPYIGSRSRVSEILSGKRPLTLDMIRNLESGLGIPAKVLVKKSQENEESIFNNWNPDIIKEMNGRGYFGKRTFTTITVPKLLKDFFASVGSPVQLSGLLRQSSYRSAPVTDKRALVAWAAYITKESKKVKAPKYKEDTVSLDFMKKVAKLSIEKDSPIAVQEFLRKNGIILIIEPHFQKTRLDGAVILTSKDNPIIGLTLRYDRMDNFWFTLMHELAHVSLHYNQETDYFYDELEDIKGQIIDEKEKEADSLAGEALIPIDKWEISPARLIPSVLAASSLAKEIGVDISIVAGKIRYEGNNWAYLNKIVSQTKVRQYFPNKKWNKK